MTKKEQKLRDQRIERVYGQHCNGIQINIMDIGKVFKEGERLIALGLGDGDMGPLLRVFTLKLAGVPVDRVDTTLATINAIMGDPDDETVENMVVEMADKVKRRVMRYDS